MRPNYKAKKKALFAQLGLVIRQKKAFINEIEREKY